MQKKWRSLTLANRNKNETTMCRVTVEVAQEMLRSFNPALDRRAAIRKWAQQLIDLRIQQIEFEDTETMSIEEARAMTHEVIRKEYAKV